MFKNLQCVILSILLHAAITHPSSVGFAEAQGLRQTMEDAHCIEIGTDHAFFGLFDGHGGKQVADFAAKNLHKNILSFLQTNKFTINESLSNGFLKTHKDLDQEFFNIKDQGCTAIAAFFKDGHLYVANAGDSRAVLSSAGKAIALSDDHKPTRPDEKKRIENLGGKIITYGVPRVNGILAISRALGDKALYPFVIPNPEIKEKELITEDELLIIACDGVWDVIDNQTAVDIVKKNLLAHQADYNKAATALKDEALRCGSTDNVSVMVINLKSFQKS